MKFKVKIRVRRNAFGVPVTISLPIEIEADERRQALEAAFDFGCELNLHGIEFDVEEIKP